MTFERGKRGQTLSLSERNVVLDILEHFLKTMNKSKAVEACSEATGRSPRMIYKLAKEREQGDLKPPKRSKRPHVKSHMRIMKYKSDVRSCIRRIVHSCFVQNIPPMLHTILETVNAIELFSPFKRGTLYNLLKDIGFEYKRRGNKGIFVENKHIISCRHKYLEKIKEAREQNKLIIYTGELWLDMANLSQDLKMQVNTTEQKHSNEVSPVLVLVHAGFIHGFIDGAKLTLLCKTDRTDVREEMDCEIYENWFFNQLLPNCPRNSIIVMDNARYNSQKIGNVPNSSWSKDDIIEWLESTGIEVDSTLLIPELIQLVNNIKDDYDTFKIDSECEKLGFEVLRPPPHHRELNPIYMVWDQIEHFLKVNDSPFKKEDMLELIDESYSNVTSDDWLSYVTEVQSNEEFLWQADCLQENIDSLISKLKWTRLPSEPSCVKIIK